MFALAPWLGAIGVGLAAVLLRFLSVSAERHRLRQHYRGRRRWYDVPVSTLSSPGYLVLSLGGSILMLAWASATVVAAAGILMLFAIPLWLGLSAVGVVYVLCLWWGPGSSRLRRSVRVATAPWTRGGRGGIYAGVLGLLLAAVLVSTLATRGPIWSPAQEAPWTDGVLGQLVRLY